MKAAAVVFATFCSILLLGVCGSTIAAIAQIESILVTGPVFSAVGFVVAFGWIASRSPASIAFGLSAPGISFFLLVLINLLSWGPAEAAHPVPAMLLGYEAVIIPVGLMALYRTLAASPQYPRRWVWQFNLRTLFVIIFAASLAFGVTRVFVPSGASIRLVIAIGGCVATVIAMGFVVWRSMRSHYPAAGAMVRGPTQHAGEAVSE